MLNVRTKSLADVQTHAIAKVTFPAISVDRRWVALVVDATISAGSALLEVLSINPDDDAETVHWRTLVTPSTPGRLPFGSSGGLRAKPAQNLVVRLADAGSGNVGYVNALVCGE